MKVLLVAHSYPRHERDMAGAFLLTLARELRSLGDEPTVLAPHASGLALRETLGGIPVERYRYADDADETLAYAGTMHEQVLRSWRARLTLVRFLHAQRTAVRDAIRRLVPDVVHVHWWFPGGLATWPRRGRQPPLVLTSHGTDLFLLDRFAPMRPVARRVFGSADQVTVISSPLVPRVRALGVAEDRISVIPMPLDREIFLEHAGPRDPDAPLLFAGRLIERKGADFAIRAAAELVRQGRGRRLDLVGDGPERARLEALASDLGLGDRVRFLGSRSPAEVAALFRSAAVLVMPAVTDWKGEQEGFGMVLVEAMHAGLPVVATRSGGIPDVVQDGETGLLVPERDATALAAAVARVLDEPALAERLAARASADVRLRFAPERIAREFHGVYERARNATR